MASNSIANQSVPPSPIRIEVGGPGSERYKSIDHVVWDDVPPFAVLTGLNGSGKTQLLEILAYRLTNTFHPILKDLSKVKVAITGDKFGPDAVAFVPSQWDLANSTTLDIAHMQNAKKQLHDRLKNPGIRNDMRSASMRARIEILLGVKNLAEISEAEFIRRLPDDYAFMLEESDVTSGLAHIFLAHRLRVAEALEGGMLREDIENLLGPAPWDVLNETLRVAEFPYRVVSPLTTKILEPYEPLFKDVGGAGSIRATDLSSGEKVLLALVMWLYNSQHHGRFPRLFLLDEPDAHLHPSMTRHLLAVIKEVLVERFGVRTIITTHSPSTVALAPASSVFEMSKTQPRIRKSPSQAETIGLLTAGLVTVSPTTRYVLVEDEDDVKFYETIRDILTDYGPSRDPRALKPAPTIVFLPASNGTGKGKVGGGKSVVTDWVDKFDSPPLDDLVRGAIDRDAGNASSHRIKVIGRYSIENYYLDPFVVFGLLLEINYPLPVPNVSISAGDEHLIRHLGSTDLQSIVTAIQTCIEPVLARTGPVDTTPMSVEFTNGMKVSYPAWMIQHRGHDLLPVYQSVFGGHSVVSPPRLQRNLRRTRLIPKELADMLDELQS